MEDQSNPEKPTPLHLLMLRKLIKIQKTSTYLKMAEELETDHSTDNVFKKYIPVLTVTACLISIILFIGINSEDNIDNWDVYKKWGAPSANDIFNGSYWGLISSNFLHTEIWHIGFNLYWLWIFGKKIEFETNKMYYGFLVLSSAIISSAAEIAVSDTTGIGLSGIGYSLFGFILIKSRTAEEYKYYLDQNTILLFLFWLMLCIVLTQTKVWEVGNAAHIGGLLWGMALAYLSPYSRTIQWSMSAIILLFVVSAIFWSPFSNSYLIHKAYELHKNQKTEEAGIVYKQILDRDADNEFAIANLSKIEVHKLSKKAYSLHKEHKFEEARKVYNEILTIDRNNEWAKENIGRLPDN